ncbi:unnamed protein product [Ostreobium quekettii]|uniref:Uncharacterized protein n=1 Tax=Ostreobium quekettii TaxID=121088 RepID=A0A8S1IZM6_9CHLO|nr:unnamed protein product [Ostreobium quekettii]
MGKRLATQGRVQESEHYFRLAVTEAHEGFGHRDPHVAAACNNLAEVYRVQGRLDAAKILYEQAVDILRVAFGEVDARTAVALHNLASIYEASGNTSEAAEYYRLSLEARSSVLGNDHMETLQSRISLARMLVDQGRNVEAHEAAEQCTKVLEDRDRGMGDINVLMDTTAVLLAACGEECTQAAASIALKALQDAKAQEVHKVSRACNTLIGQLTSAQAFGIAEDICTGCGDTLSRILENSHGTLPTPFLWKAMVELAKHQGSPDAALTYTEKAVDICEGIWQQRLPGNGPWGWAALLGFSGAGATSAQILAAGIELSHSLNLHGSVLEALGRKHEAANAWMRAAEILNSDHVLKALEGSQRNKQLETLAKLRLSTLEASAQLLKNAERGIEHSHDAQNVTA